ncbi:MAG: hypothetical protein KF862_17670 [Chitinophagaceae bacterium]|nr:hypothetical protein [Chitinophagaceae bacterium]
MNIVHITCIPFNPMVHFINSPLKLSGALLMFSGIGIAVFTLADFLFLGISVFLLGLLMQVTANLLLKSTLRQTYKKVVECTLVLFILGFCGILMLDFFGLIKIIL